MSLDEAAGARVSLPICALILVDCQVSADTPNEPICMGQQLASLKRQCQSRGPSCGFALLRIAAQDVWVLVLGWSRTMATASCWVSLEPAEKA